ncbi:MAG: polysaccharide biosynthesis protein [Candidatus Omnitrophica bacterium]|nr:polysaccharide biosynthesis protein [Candidatus Omnitrophota bacterium]
MSKQILRNIFSNYLVNFIQLALGFIIVPFLIKKLGQNAYGLIVLAESTIGFFEIVTVNIRIALSRYVTFSMSQEKYDDFMEYLSAGRFMLNCAGGLILIIGSIISYNFSNIFQVPDHLVSESKILFFLIIIGFFISVPNILYWSILYAKQRFDLINKAATAGIMTRAGCVFILFSILPDDHVNLVMYGVFYLLMKLIQNILVYRWHFSMLEGIKIVYRKFKMSRIKEIASFGIHASISNISGLLYNQTATILINIFWGPQYNTIYDISMKFPNMIRNLFVQATWTLTPTFTDYAARNDKLKVKQLLFVYTKAMSLITIPIGFLFIMLAYPLISIWVGEQFEMSSKLLIWHMIPLIFHIPMAVTNCVFLAYGKVKFPSYFRLIAAVINLLLAVFLVKFFSLGLFGFAYSAALIIFLQAGIIVPWYACKITKLSLREYWVQTFLIPFSWAATIIFGSFFLIHQIQSGNHFSLLLFAILTVAAVIYIVGSYKFILDPTERGFMQQFIQNKFKKGKVSVEDNTI